MGGRIYSPRQSRRDGVAGAAGVAGDHGGEFGAADGRVARPHDPDRGKGAGAWLALGSQQRRCTLCLSERWWIVGLADADEAGSEAPGGVDFPFGVIDRCDPDGAGCPAAVGQFRQRGKCRFG